MGGYSDCQMKRGGAASIDDVIARLHENGELAVKRLAGSLGEGFYKAAYCDGKYKLNAEELDREGFQNRLLELKGYLITEYLRPHMAMSPFSANTANTIRYLIARDGDEWRMVKSYIRFGTKRSGFVENYAAGGVLCFISDDGVFVNGNIYDFASGDNKIIYNHPDTGAELKGSIPLWTELVQAADDFCRQFPQMKYLGIDFVVTKNNGIKILEINSLTSLDALQMQGSLLTGKAGNFYKRNCIDRN